MKNNNNWLWWAFGGVALLGVGVGTYLYFKNKNAEDNPPKATEPPKPPAPTPSGSTGSNQTISNPFKDENEVMAFQAWVNNVKNGSLKVDGKYGPLTDAEFKKYYQEYIAAVESQNAPKLSEGWSKIKDQMLNKSVWGDNTNVDMESESRLRFGVNIVGGLDAYANFIPTGYFWIEIGKGEKKHGGTWTYNNGKYLLKLDDGTWQADGADLGKLIKQVMKFKYPNFMKYYQFSEGESNIDDVMNVSGKNYVDSQDSML